MWFFVFLLTNISIFGVMFWACHVKGSPNVIDDTNVYVKFSNISLKQAQSSLQKTLHGTMEITLPSSQKPQSTPSGIHPSSATKHKKFTIS
jgi:hypothetical protein